MGTAQHTPCLYALPTPNKLWVQQLQHTWPRVIHISCVFHSTKKGFEGNVHGSLCGTWHNNTSMNYISTSTIFINLWGWWGWGRVCRWDNVNDTNGPNHDGNWDVRIPKVSLCRISFSGWIVLEIRDPWAPAYIRLRQGCDWLAICKLKVYITYLENCIVKSACCSRRHKSSAVCARWKMETFRKMWVQVAFTRQSTQGYTPTKWEEEETNKQKLGKEKWMGKQLSHCMD